MFPFLPEYEHKKALIKFFDNKTVREHSEEFSMKFELTDLKEQKFQGNVWYRANTKQFGLFKQEDNRWLLILQNR